jgi:hypothetical protein
VGRESWRRRVGLSCALGVLLAVTASAPLASAKTAAKVNKNKPRTAAVLFVVQGTGGSYADTGDGTATLTLTGVNGQATWFNDRPQRQAGSASPKIRLMP